MKNDEDSDISHHQRQAGSASVEPRTSLADLLREELRLTATHLGCEQGVCGACTMLIDGQPARACIALAVGLDGADIRTLEGLDQGPVMLTLKAAFHDRAWAAMRLLHAGNADQRLGSVAAQARARAEIRVAISGNLCRCTGYQGIVRSILRAAGEVRTCRQREGA